MRDVRKNYNVFVDGRGYAGQTDDFDAPKLNLKTEDFQGGGMAGPVELTMAMDKLEAGFTLLSSDPDVLAKFSVREGSQVQFSVREVLESLDGTVTPLVHNMRGKIKGIDPGTSKAGEKATTKVSLALTYYKLTHGARVVQEFDVVNMVAMQDGVDVLAPVRTALGR